MFNVHLNQDTMKTLIVSKAMFTEMLSGIIQSGVSFQAIEIGDKIKVTFTGGY